MLVDLKDLDLDGQTASDKLGAIGITCNKNLIPNDPRTPATTSGLRFGVSAMTSRGMTEADARQIGSWIADCLLGRLVSDEAVRREIKAMADRFDYY